jgi:hypothetical protein
VVDAVRATVKAAGVSLYLSRIRTREDQESAGGKYHHMIVHGFTPDDDKQIKQIAGLADVDGLVFRIEGATSPWQAARSARAACSSHGLKASLHIRMTKGPPGLQQTDDDWVANRVAEAVAAACAFEDVHVYADTFADVDRGYYRRHGVVDRFYNPRPGFAVVRHLVSALGQTSEWSPDIDPEKIALIGADGRRAELIPLPATAGTGSPAATGILIDLLSGERLSAAVQPESGIVPPPTSTLSVLITDTETQPASHI